MSFKPVVLIYDIDNLMVDEVAAEIGSTGRYTSINTYNEANAMDAIKQYDRGFGLLTNKLSCIITGWNHHRTLKEQFLYRLRAMERKSPFRAPTPVIIVSEDHREDLKGKALDTNDGSVCAYLDRDAFRDSLADILYKVVYENRAAELNESAVVEFRQQAGE